MHNPARLVDNRREDNERVRWLTHGEEKRLRAVIKKRCPDQLPALTVCPTHRDAKGRAVRIDLGGRRS
jgi:hypothetical protein